MLTLAVMAGLAGSITNVTTNRTQAGQVSRAIAHYGHPGDIVAYCPDQLGPAVEPTPAAQPLRPDHLPHGPDRPT